MPRIDSGHWADMNLFLGSLDGLVFDAPPELPEPDVLERDIFGMPEP